MAIDSVNIRRDCGHHEKIWLRGRTAAQRRDAIHRALQRECQTCADIDALREIARDVQSGKRRVIKHDERTQRQKHGS